jgi:hypothetical protein
MNDVQHIHKRKVQWRRRDLKAQTRGRRLSKRFCLAKSLGPNVFKAPLDFSQVEIPSTYEE